MSLKLLKRTGCSGDRTLGELEEAGSVSVESGLASNGCCVGVYEVIGRGGRPKGRLVSGGDILRASGVPILCLGRRASNSGSAVTGSQAMAYGWEHNSGMVSFGARRYLLTIFNEINAYNRINRTS